MTATLNRTRTQPRPHSSNGQTPASSMPKPRSARLNRGRATLGAMVTALSVIAVMTLYSGADDRTEVLALVGRVPVGQAIRAADLTVVEVPADSTLATVAADRINTVIGQVALAPLEAGTLLSPAQTAAQPLIPEGSAVVGGLLKLGQYPVGLRVGDRVRIVETPVATSNGAAAPIDRGSALVVDLAEASAGTAGITVSLLVANDASIALSSAGSAGRLSVAVVPS